MRIYLLLFLCALCFDIGICQTILASGLSAQDQATVLNAHNDCRKRIAAGFANLPKGINLKRMKYDGKLAAEAQKIANTMVFQHVKVSDSRWSVGQNLYMTSSTAPGSSSDWNGAVKGWFDEYKQYTYSKCCSSSATGHFTQVIWANSEYLGCGWTYYKSSGSFPYNKFYVCNYGPAGNYIGQYPYETGSSGCENLC